ncbi:MAG: dihydroorotase [Legionella sp.]|nr:MAG: dihydroorotase [Legionella sp.]PJD97458.1 MAG: dihydroorotase [Legionella sp.]
MLIINRPDDWHVHFRDGDILEHTVPATASHFARALVMPNLIPALTSVKALHEYRKRILAAANNSRFVPYMTCYLNESVLPEELAAIAKDPYILGGKLYPAGATTHSDEGVKSLKTLYPLFEIMQQEDLVLQIHGEVTHGDIFARESRFIEEHLKPLSLHFPRLRIVLEHISSKAAVEFVTQASPKIAATITPHHLLFNRNQLLAGGIRPHYYCLPILKQARDQKALQQAVASGNPKFFAGTDSAPHPKTMKEAACGCAGIYSAPYALAFYAQLFEQIDQLHRLNYFMSYYGALFYQLPPNKDCIELIKKPNPVPLSLSLGAHEVVPMAAGETLPWSVNEHQ